MPRVERLEGADARLLKSLADFTGAAMQAFADVQSRPAARVPPRRPPDSGVGVACTAHLVPFHRSAKVTSRPEPVT